MSAATRPAPVRNGHDRRPHAARPHIERVPPHCIEEERAVLGSVLVAQAHLGATTYPPTVDALVARGIGLLAPTDFYSDAHQNLWQVLRTMASRGEPIDAITVFRACEREGLLQVTGGRDYLVSLSSAVTSPAHMEHYAATVRAKAEQRRAEADAVQDLAELQAELISPVDLRDRQRRRIAAHLPDAGPRRFLSPAQVRERAGEAGEPWLVERLLPEGQVVAIGGPPKLGKSTLVGRLVSAVLTGAPCIGLACRQSPVVYLTEETSRTFRQLLDDAGIADGAPLSVLSRELAHGLSWRSAVELAVAEAQRIGARLIVIDCLRFWARLAPDAEKDAGAMQETLRVVLDLASAQGIAVLVIHHVTKDKQAQGGDRLSGSTALGGGVDGFVIFDREGRGRSTVRVLDADGRGHGWAHGLSYELTAEGELRRLADATESASAVHSAAALRAVRGSPGAEREALAKAVRVRAARLSPILDDLRAGGLVTRTGQGRRGDRYRYWPVVSIPSGSGESGVESEGDLRSSIPGAPMGPPRGNRICAGVVGLRSEPLRNPGKGIPTGTMNGVQAGHAPPGVDSPSLRPTPRSEPGEAS